MSVLSQLPLEQRQAALSMTQAALAQSIADQLNALETSINFLIEITPSGHDRNIVTESNIMRMNASRGLEQFVRNIAKARAQG